MAEHREALAARSRAETRRQLPKAEQAAVERQYAGLHSMGYASAACGVIGLLLAVLALIGRATGMFILGSLVPGSKVMVPAAALSFALMAAAVIALGLPRPPAYRFVRACGLAVVLISLTRVLEYGLGASWGVGDLFVFRYLPAPADTRYSAIAAAAIAVYALGPVFFTWPSTRRLANGFGISGVVSGALFCLSHIVDGAIIHQMPLVSVALPSALGLMAVGTGLTICGSRWQRAAEWVVDLRIAADQAELARVSEELGRQRNEVEAILSSAPNAILSFDRVGRLVRMNPVGRQMLGEIKLPGPEGGLPAEVLPGILDEHGKPIAREHTATARALKGEIVRGLMANLRRTAAGPVWVSVSAVPLHDAAGEVDGAVVMLTDVTALREAREESQRYARELQTIMDHAPVGIILYDPAGNIRRVNEAARRTLGMTEEMMSKPATERFLSHDIVDEEGTPIMPDRGVVAAVLAGQSANNVLANFRNTPQGSVWVSMSGAPIIGGDGQMEGVVAVFSDVTRLHETQKRAQQLAEELQAVLTSIADGVVVYDAQGRASQENPAAERLLQYPPDVRGMTWHERIQVEVPLGEDGEALAPAHCPLQRALDGERVVGFTMRFRLTFKDPAEVTPWLSVSAAPVRYGDGGEATGAVLVYSDISQLRQAEEELRSYRDHLEGLVAQRTARLETNQRRLRALAAKLSNAEQRERQRLASVVHDEIAQTLSAIKLQLSTLRAAAAPPAASQISTIVETVEQAISQSRAIMMDLSPPILQQQGLLEALRWWALQVQEKRGLEVVVDDQGALQRLPSDLEATTFQIVKELLQNTVKYAQATQASIRVRSDDARLEIEVADNGVGFDPTTLEATEKGGFGLFSVRERIVYLGGEFQIQSAPGEGTRSLIAIPLPQGQAMEEATEAKETAREAVIVPEG